MSHRLWRLHCVASVFAVLMLCATEASAWTRPVAHWMFDRCDGKKVADESGLGHEGQLVGDALCVLQGPSGGSAVFNGNARIYVKDAPGLNLKRNVTVAAWVRPDDAPGPHTIVNKWYAKDSYMLLVQDGRFRFTVAVPGGTQGEQLVVDAPARAEVWSHVAGTYDGKNLKLYVNGQLAAERRFSVSRDLQQSDRPVIIGNHPSWNAYRGHIDDVRIYDQVLAGTDIQDVIAEARPLVGEVGRIEVGQNARTEWHRVRFRNKYKSPVVMLQSTTNGKDPMTLRVKSVSPDDFVFQIDEWSYLDGAHGKEVVHYLVLEEGKQVLYDGTVIQAGHVDTGDAWKAATFSVPFAGDPVVLAQVQTANDAAPIATRLRGVTRTGFETRVQEEEKSDGTHASEKIGYVAFAVGLGNAGESRIFEAGVTKQAVTDKPFELLFARNYLKVGAPLSTLDAVFLSAIQTFEGPETAVPRLIEQKPAKANIFLQEDQSKDTEQTHKAEVVGYIVFENTGDLFGGNAQWSDEGIITKDGGTMTCGGSTVTVNAGAVTRPVTLYCAEEQDNTPADGTTTLGPAVTLGPLNLDFKDQVCITLPYDKAKLAGKPAAYRKESVFVMVRDPANGRPAILHPESIDEAKGTVKVCTRQLARFNVRFADNLAVQLDTVARLPVPDTREAVCSKKEIEDLVDFDDHWGMGHRAYFFTGMLSEATVFGSQRHVGFDRVWDLYNQQFSGYGYQGSGFQPAIVNFGVSYYQGLGWGAHENVLSAWGGRFVGASFSFSPLPVLSVGASAFLAANEIGGLIVPVMPPGGTYGGAVSIGVGLALGPSLPVGYTISSAVWEPSSIINATALARFQAFGLEVAPDSSWLQFTSLFPSSRKADYAKRGKHLASAILLDNLAMGVHTIDIGAAAVYIGAMRETMRNLSRPMSIDEYCECLIRAAPNSKHEKCPFTAVYEYNGKTVSEDFIIGNGPRTQGDWQKKFYMAGPDPGNDVQASCTILSDTEVQAYVRPREYPLHESIGTPGRVSVASKHGETITCTARPKPAP